MKEFYLTVIYQNSNESFDLESNDSDEIIQKIKALSFDEAFEIVLVREDNCVNILNEVKSHRIYLMEGIDLDSPFISYTNKDLEKTFEIIERFLKDSNLDWIYNHFKEYEQEKTKQEKKKYQAWKRRYDEERKSERFDFLKPYAYGLVLFVLLLFAGNAVYTGEYKFIAQETTFVDAVITKDSKPHLMRGFNFQRINFEYEYQGVKYVKSKRFFRGIGVMMKGDEIKLKIAVKHPERNKIVGYY